MVVDRILKKIYRKQLLIHNEKLNYLNEQAEFFQDLTITYSRYAKAYLPASHVPYDKIAEKYQLKLTECLNQLESHQEKIKKLEKKLQDLER